MKKQNQRHLTFCLGNENYGMPLETVKEIIAILPITKIPKTPNYIKGIINLRGKIIPIMDLRLKFSLKEEVYNERTCIIVVEINKEKLKKQVGVVVDHVSEVVEIQENNIQKVNKEEIDIKEEFITGIGKIKDKVIMMLDMENILSGYKIKNSINI